MITITGLTQAQVNTLGIVNKGQTDVVSNQATLNSIMTDIVHCLLNGKAVPKALLNKWNSSYQNLQSAYGSGPGISKP
jgi:hypothetical protein